MVVVQLLVILLRDGADFVMMIGHDECDGEIVNGVMKFYGIASESAMERHNVNNSYRGVEGKTSSISWCSKRYNN